MGLKWTVDTVFTGFAYNLFIGMFSMQIYAFTTMVLLVTKVVHCECKCFETRNKPEYWDNYISVNTCSALNAQWVRTASSHLLIPQTKRCVYCWRTFCIADATLVWILVRIRTGRVAAGIVQPILSNKMPTELIFLLRSGHWMVEKHFTQILYLLVTNFEQQILCYSKHSNFVLAS